MFLFQRFGGSEILPQVAAQAADTVAMVIAATTTTPVATFNKALSTEGSFYQRVMSLYYSYTKDSSVHERNLWAISISIS